jgi:hypothetical protein
MDYKTGWHSRPVSPEPRTNNTTTPNLYIHQINPMIKYYSKNIAYCYGCGEKTAMSDFCGCGNTAYCSRICKDKACPVHTFDCELLAAFKQKDCVSERRVMSFYKLGDFVEMNTHIISEDLVFKMIVGQKNKYCDLCERAVWQYLELRYRTTGAVLVCIHTITSLHDFNHV